MEKERIRCTEKFGENSLCLWILRPSVTKIKDMTLFKWQRSSILSKAMAGQRGLWEGFTCSTRTKISNSKATYREGTTLAKCLIQPDCPAQMSSKHISGRQMQGTWKRRRQCQRATEGELLHDVMTHHFLGSPRSIRIKG